MENFKVFYKDNPCWSCMAREHGYENPKAMLVDFYSIKKMVPPQISELLNVSTMTVRTRLKFYGITNNSWGGVRKKYESIPYHSDIK